MNNKNKLFRNVILLPILGASLLNFTSCNKPFDYSLETNWVDIEKSGTKPVDCFFIYPTVAMTTINQDGFANIDEQREAILLRRAQTSVYQDSCNIFMPYYRQAAMTYADKLNKDNQAYLDLLYNNKPYQDIEAALDYYFKYYNDGKPFIIAGHSQGSAMTINVLTHYLQEHKDYLSRMIAAYPIGFAPSEDIFNDKTGLKFATKADDTNVVISFTTEGPTAEGKSILLPEKPMVINPLNWKTDDTYASASENKGSLVLAKSPDYDHIVTTPGLDDAQINLTRKTLINTTRTKEEYTEAPNAFSTESFHEREYSMYYSNLKENVATRVAAYLAK